jgi:hypothetical protein
LHGVGAACYDLCVIRAHRWAVVVPAILLVLLAPSASGDAAPERWAGNGERKYPSQFVVSPDFPGSSLKLKVLGHPRTRRNVKVAVSGVNQSPYDGSFFLDLFVANRSAVSRCPTRAEMVNNDANGVKEIARLAAGLPLGANGAFSRTVIYRSGTTRKVRFCAYVTWYYDDVSAAALKHDFPRSR